MFCLFSCCTPIMKTGAVVGGMAGFGLGVWASIQFVQPTLVDEGLSEKMAAGLTFVIALLGGIEACITAGMIAGALAAPFIKGGYYGTKHLVTTFFGGEENTQAVVGSGETRPLLEV